MSFPLLLLLLLILPLSTWGTSNISAWYHMHSHLTIDINYLNVCSRVVGGKQIIATTSSQDLVYVFNFNGMSGNSIDPSQADNCYHNATTDYYHCLNIWELNKAFIPVATKVSSVDSLYDNAT